MQAEKDSTALSPSHAPPSECKLRLGWRRIIIRVSFVAQLIRSRAWRRPKTPSPETASGAGSTSRGVLPGLMSLEPGAHTRTELLMAPGRRPEALDSLSDLAAQIMAIAPARRRIGMAHLGRCGGVTGNVERPSGPTRGGMQPAVRACRAPFAGVSSCWTPHARRLRALALLMRSPR